MIEYLIELREAHSQGKLCMDYIYVGAYDWLFARGMVGDYLTAEDERAVASRYVVQLNERFKKGFYEVKGQVVAACEFEWKAAEKKRRVDSYTKKMLVYNFLISNNAILILKNSNNESNETAS